MAFKEKKKSGGWDSFREEFIRRFKTSPFLFTGTVIILVIVIIAFVFVPAIVPTAGGQMPDLAFGTYNKIPIAYAQGNFLARTYENARQNAMYYQYQVDDRLLWMTAFQETVIHTGILDEMKRAGYSVPEETVNRRIAEQPEWLAAYRRGDNTAKLAFWQEVQEDITEQYYRNDLNGFKIPPAEAAFIGAMALKERRFSMVSLPLSGYPDGEAASFAAANPALFRMTRLSKITLGGSEKEARQVLASVRGGVSSFEDAARTHSRDAYADRGGEMEPKMAYALAWEIPGEADRETVIALGKGEISPVIKVPEGWAFFRAEEAAVPADTGDPASLDEIRNYMRLFERGRMDDWLLREAETLAALIREEGFDEALDGRGLVKRGFGPLPLDYEDIRFNNTSVFTPLFTSLSSFGIDELINAEGSERFWQAAFSTPLSSPSQPLVLGNNIVILYPEEETEAADKAAELEENYTSFWLSRLLDISIQNHFITSEKLDNHFESTYTRYFQSAY